MRKFQGEERISGGALVKALEQRTRQSQVETCLDQALQRPEAEPANVDVLRALVGQQSCARRLLVADAADRQQQADRLVPQPARRKPKRERRRSVEPLKIVNRYYHRDVGNGTAKRTK